MAAQKSRTELVLSYFRKSDTNERLAMMRRNTDALESVILSLQSQLKQVTETRAELLGMIEILKKDNVTVDNVKELTEQLETWLLSSGSHLYASANAAEVSTDAFRRYVERTIYNAPRGDVLWALAQQTPPQDYARVNWSYLADVVKSAADA